MIEVTLREIDETFYSEADEEVREYLYKFTCMVCDCPIVIGDFMGWYDREGERYFVFICKKCHEKEHKRGKLICKVGDSNQEHTDEKSN